MRLEQVAVYLHRHRLTPSSACAVHKSFPKKLNSSTCPSFSLCCHPRPTMTNSNFKRTYILLLFLFSLLLSAFAAPSKCATLRLPLERCASTPACLQQNPSQPDQACLGRDSARVLQQCPNADVSTCFCLPSSLISCTTHANCPDATFCGRSSTSNATVCAGCRALNDPVLALSTVSPVPPARCAVRRARPCGRALDFCSPTLPCETGYRCAYQANDADRTVFACTTATSPCRCYKERKPPASGNSNSRKLMYVDGAPCKRNRDCWNGGGKERGSGTGQGKRGKNREICAVDTRSDTKVCVTCAAVSNIPFLSFARTDRKARQQRKLCAKLARLPDSPPTTNESSLLKSNSVLGVTSDNASESFFLAHYFPKNYAPSSSGLTYDTCHSSRQCVGSLSCVRFRSIFTDPLDVARCNGRSDSTLCFCRSRKKLKSCTTGRNCPQGETCVTAKAVGLDRNCASLSFLATIGSSDYKIVGELRKAPSVAIRRLSTETCTNDWQCKFPRRCTHAADPTGWGGCAGRRACFCQNVVYPACDGNTTRCKEDGEVCVAYVGGRTTPMCVSKRALRTYQDPLLYQLPRMENENETEVKIGEGRAGDICVNDDQCLEGRSCMHVNELAGKCDGRQGCTCRWDDQLGACNETAAGNCEQNEECVDIKDSYPQRRRCMSRQAFKMDIYNIFKAY